MSQAHLYETTFVETCCDMVAFALVYYECIVTLDREVSLVWGKRFTGATALFLLNRYTAMLKYPIYVVGLTQLSDESFTVVNLLSRVLEIIPYFVWFAFLTLRVYAICGHDWRPAFPVAVAAFMPVASNIYLYSTTYTVNYPLPIGCVWASDMPMNVYNSLLISTRTSAILSDVLVLAITWWKTHGISKVVKEANLPVSLSSLLLRDGTIYFLILLTLNTLHIAFTLTGKFTYTLALEEPIITVLTSRFILNLREVDVRSRHPPSFDLSRPSFVRRPWDAPSSLVFSFVAPLGAPLVQGDASASAESARDIAMSWDADEPSTRKSQSDVEFPGLRWDDVPSSCSNVRLASEQP